LLWEEIRSYLLQTLFLFPGKIPARALELGFGRMVSSEKPQFLPNWGFGRMVSIYIPALSELITRWWENSSLTFSQLASFSSYGTIVL
jgi:hypothetical protein